MAWFSVRHTNIPFGARRHFDVSIVHGFGDSTAPCRGIKMYEEKDKRVQGKSGAFKDKSAWMLNSARETHLNMMRIYVT